MKSISNLSKIALIVGATFTLAACGSSEEAEAPQLIEEAPGNPPPPPPPPTGGGDSGSGGGDDSGDDGDESGDDGDDSNGGGGSDGGDTGGDDGSDDEDTGGDDGSDDEDTGGDDGSEDEDTGGDDGSEDEDTGGDDGSEEEDTGGDDGSEDEDTGGDDGSEDDGSDEDSGNDEEQGDEPQQLLFEEDIAEDIVQSTPTDVNIPLGLQAAFDVEYKGSFRVIAGGESGSSYAVGTLGINPENNSLFMAGHTQHNAIAEFSIPAELSLSEDPSSVVLATVLQDYVRVLEKQQVGNPTDKITGMMLQDGELFLTSEIWYDAGGTNQDNFQIFNNSYDISSSDYKGMFQIQGQSRAAGYISKVPSELVEELGGTHITGWASNYSITSRYSQGPSLFVFNPMEASQMDVTESRTVESEPLMVFPFEEGKELVANSSDYGMNISPIWGPLSKAMHGFIVPGTRYFLALGSNGGVHSGIGYKITQDDGNICGGQCPYEAGDIYNYFWLFNIDDMLSAENPWDVRPVSYGKWSHPYDNGGRNRVLGATFDDTTSTLYLSVKDAARVGQYDRPPMIIAYELFSKD